MQVFAKIISYLFHPLFMPLYSGLIILLTNPMRFTLGGALFKHALLQIVIFTLVFPITVVFMMWRLELVSSLKMENKNERIFPFIAGIVFYLWGYLMFRPESKTTISGDPIIASLFLGLFISVCIALFITIFDKISIHTISAGSLMALVIELFNYASVSLIMVLLLVVLIAGLIGSARLLLKAHNYNQVMFGYVVGYLSMWLGFHFPFG